MNQPVYTRFLTLPVQLSTAILTEFDIFAILSSTIWTVHDLLLYKNVSVLWTTLITTQTATPVTAVACAAARTRTH